ncbi:hypothetical protein R3W88_024143 [Solanum pinnatisectum]|uniref:Uncharacterized protein n=1 Tax=Solanum pinnatisectum TaxID=50273 RepID=A0AAV9LZF4_9SOLN|nr:hypothetical protein R3W88_024143 [Solanum pinnatisectum]
MAILMANLGRLIRMAISRKSLPKVSSLFSPSSSLTSLSTTGDGDGGTGMKAQPPLLNHSSNPIRRSGNYQPPSWDFQFIHSLYNPYAGDKYIKRCSELKKEMKKNLMVMVEGSIQELDAKLELIDNLPRLGVSYHFKDEIMEVLRSVQPQEIIHYTLRPRSLGSSDNMVFTSLKVLSIFFLISSFYKLNDFKDEQGNFNQSLCEDTKGLLQLYEASFLSTESETSTLLESANIFANGIVELVRHALELPLHCKMLRVERRWYIKIYEKIPNVDPLLLEFAKLDFNIVQATHQQDLRNLWRWWNKSLLAEKLPFSRDRIVETLLWIVTAMATVIDDIYDVYATLDELKLFTHAVERMEIKAMNQLPDYMKICYLALFNTTTEIAYEVLKQLGINAMPYLTKSIKILSSLSLYIYIFGFPYNGLITIAAPMILVHSLFLVTNPITKEVLDSLTNCSDIIRWSATIIRDVPKSIQCYMNEKGGSEEDARKHINFMIKETWKLINSTAQRDNSLFSKTFIGCAVNSARASHSIYQHGDGHGIQNSLIKNRIFQLFFEPITISIP